MAFGSTLCNRIRQFTFTGWTIWALEKMFGSTSLDCKLIYLRTLQRETVGREIAEMLDRKNYRLIPKFENHDLKHIVLNYDMTMKDEIRMQAYLVGNGNHTLPCFIFLSLGVLYPTIWKDLPTAFRQGKKNNTIHFLTLDNCMNRSLAEVRMEYGRRIETTLFVRRNS